jgi:uncharacterized protein DUF6538
LAAFVVVSQRSHFGAQAHGRNERQTRDVLRLKVPVRLQAAVARERKQGKKRQSFLKKSLGTKDLREANVRAKLVLAGFDQTLSRAAAAVERAEVVPVQHKSLNPAEIARMADGHLGTVAIDPQSEPSKTVKI